MSALVYAGQAVHDVKEIDTVPRRLVQNVQMMWDPDADAGIKNF